MGIYSDTRFLESGKIFLLTFLMRCISQLQGSHLFDYVMAINIPYNIICTVLDDAFIRHRDVPREVNPGRLGVPAPLFALLLLNRANEGDGFTSLSS